MINGMFIYFSFILIIIITIILRKKPVLVGALGLFAVGIAESGNFFSGIQIAFRSLVVTAADLLPIILLIGLVVAMSALFKETGADQIILGPLLKLKNIFAIYWLIGLLLLVLSLFLWPTPAVTLLGALLMPLLNNSKMNPIGLAVGLCIFGEGIGLAGDFVIQGAPGLVAKSAGIAIEDVIARSVPLVLGSGFLAAVIGYWQSLALNRRQAQSAQNSEMLPQETAEGAGSSPGHISRRKKITLAVIFIALFACSTGYLLLGGLRGDSAAAITGGMAILILIIGSVLSDYRSSLNTFVRYIQNGMKLAMSVFAPIIVIAGFFLLGTKDGSENILLRSGAGYLEQLALYSAHYLALNIFTGSVIVIVTAVLGAMSGSGFSALPLVGGVAAALGQAAGLPVVPLAVLGQAAAIWTDATVIPWGFPAVVGAITRTDPVRLVRYGLLPWLAALSFMYVLTILTFHG